jgi:hypothetical protein
LRNLSTNIRLAVVGTEYALESGVVGFFDRLPE